MARDSSEKKVRGKVVAKRGTANLGASQCRQFAAGGLWRSRNRTGTWWCPEWRAHGGLPPGCPPSWAALTCIYLANQSIHLSQLLSFRIPGFPYLHQSLAIPISPFHSQISSSIVFRSSVRAGTLASHILNKRLPTAPVSTLAATKLVQLEPDTCHEPPNVCVDEF